MSYTVSTELKEKLLAEAMQHGFSLARITSADSIPEAKEQLTEFLQSGFHGQMDWLEKRSNWRSSPKSLWPEVRSIIMLSENTSRMQKQRG